MTAVNIKHYDNLSLIFKTLLQQINTKNKEER